MAEVTITDLRKEYGSLVATDDVSLTVADGELVVLVGPSGCGKTTTLRSVAGLETPTSGTIEFDGVDVTDRAPQNRDISMVFQDLALYPHMTAEENIAFPLRAEGSESEAEVESSVAEMAETVDCAEFLDQQVVELSGGQQQRVALARALIRKPEVFLMDEPFSDLDELLKRRLRSEVVRIQKELGITMIHVTHDQEEAMTMGDRIVVMNDGQVVQIGDPETVFSRPRNLFVATFIGSPQMNQFECTVDQSGVRTDGGLDFRLDGHEDVLARAGGSEITLGVRPQHLSWTADRPEDDGRLHIPVTVDVVEQIGTEEIVRCLTEGGREITAVVPVGTRSIGDRGYLAMDEGDVHLFDGYGPNAGRLD